MRLHYRTMFIQRNRCNLGRQGHVAVNVDGVTYAVGGSCGEFVYMSDGAPLQIHSFRFGEINFDQLDRLFLMPLTIESFSADLSWHLVDTTGDVPMERTHPIALGYGSRILVWGGWNRFQDVTDNVYFLNTGKLNRMVIKECE